MSVYVITQRDFVVDSEGAGPPPLRWEPARGERLVSARVGQGSFDGKWGWRWTLIVEAIGESDGAGELELGSLADGERRGELAEQVRRLGARLGLSWEPDRSVASMVGKVANEVESLRRHRKRASETIRAFQECYGTDVARKPGGEIYVPGRDSPEDGHRPDRAPGRLPRRPV